MIISTAPNTVLAFEFLAGGRVGINTDSTVMIDNETTVSALGRATLLDQASMWVKMAKTTEPLEIQTNGGVMGIKG